MRLMLKGGVWTNTQDEIVKACVMKYGKNQWCRLSSLVSRKSSKQLKSRWYEWLDPSVKKTEWTRHEDEKLLHLAKLMPTQWRTIAPIVGRTTLQCLERYETLLDAAGGNNYEAGDDPRKLRPGEIDPNLESRPSRRDPVDMDDDDIEMLSEARARLANTRGKKAKRKAREKQLQEARRLASLQKKRELKAARIDFGQRKRKRNGIDYNAEIPFEKKPPLGFYDVMDENQNLEQTKFPITVEELEGEKRSDKEARLRKQDAARNSIWQRQDEPFAMLEANRRKDLEAVRKRPKLNLPAPQIPDYELMHIARYRLSDLSEQLSQGSGATRVLLDYAHTPSQGATSLRTPQRTPASQHDMIMMEAENQARSRVSRTPLLGGQNPELHPSDFSGVTPKKMENQTTTLITTPRIGLMPLRDGPSFGMTPKGTPIRDEMHINDDIAKMELPRQADVRRNLHSGLTSLPQPKNDYQIMVQPVPEDNEVPEEIMEEDMSDRIFKEKAEDETKLLQTELPRPSLDEGNHTFLTPTLIEQADMMVRKELLSSLEHDGLKSLTGENVQKEKMTALQDEFEIVRKRMDEDTKKAHKFEHKIKVLTSGYQLRGRNLWSQIEATLKLVDNAETELKCFHALRNQEQLSASRRVDTLWREVQKQKELEQTLQKRYGCLLSAQATVQKEYAAKECN